MMNKIKKIFKAFFKIIRVVFFLIYKIIKTIFFLLFFLFKLIFRVFDYAAKLITNKLRFSITFKITITYVLIFIFVFLFMSIGIVASFHDYIRENPPENYVFLLTTLLVVFNVIGTLIIIILGSMVSKKLISPVNTMTNTVKEISINALDKRLDVSGSKDELKDLAKTFNDMLDRIQKSVEQQNQFVSDASHELRTPISVIQGYANLLTRWGKDDKKVLDESITAIQSEAENMKYLIEDLLFLAREDNNTHMIEKSEFRMDEVITEILRETRLIAANHNIINEKNEEFDFYADKKLLKEAVRILLENSIKYTPSGGTIKINSYRKNNKAIISVEDTGVGISKEDLPHIFDRFYRADKSRTKGSGGTGLGLAIAKWIIESHQGKISVWSKINSGTIFRIELPLDVK